jgi:hypothetical protein
MVWKAAWRKLGVTSVPHGMRINKGRLDAGMTPPRFKSFIIITYAFRFASTRDVRPSKILDPHVNAECNVGHAEPITKPKRYSLT